jgi:hypothetical protein
MRMKTWTVPLLLLGMALAGCSGGGGDPSEDDLPDPGELDVTSTTGGIRGVIVDQAIRPVKGAAVEIAGPDQRSAQSDDGGIFTVTGLKPGTYLLRASHPLYDTAQTSVEVVAGEREPPTVKMQLSQVVFEKPYIRSAEFKGFIVCSVGTYAFASEECGEGVGVPCIQDPVPCGRVGGQGNNQVQYDFYPESPALRSIVVEQIWTPNAEATGELYTVLATDWTCDPSCSGNELSVATGPSPLLLRADFKDGKGAGIDNVTTATRFSTFTWPNWNSDPEDANVALNQDFQLFVTMSYVLPLPEGWSYLNGSPDPFQGT